MPSSRRAPLIDAWYCCDLPLPRAATAAQLATRARALTPAPAVSEHADPSTALAAALSAADPADRILVFGSFLTVGPALAWLGAAH